MGRNKKQSLNYETWIKLLAKKDFEALRKEFEFMNNWQFIKSLSSQEARELYFFLEKLGNLLSKEEDEIKKVIADTEKVKKAYLG